MENYLPLKDISRMSGCAPSTIVSYIKSGAIPAVRVGSRIGVDPVHVPKLKELKASNLHRRAQNGRNALKTVWGQRAELEAQLVEVNQRLARIEQMLSPLAGTPSH
jgi:hypothetical protein